MAEPGWVLRLEGVSESEAQSLGEALDNLIAPEPLAVSLNETNEAEARWNVVGYFSDRQSAELARRQMPEPARAWVIEPLLDIDWVRRSLKGLAPVSAGRFFLHGSHDRARRRTGGVSLEIDAATAFGTGHHGSTAGCLVLFDRLLKSTRPRSVLDFGCGSGVLAIAAARALRRPVDANDSDIEAVKVTGANARLNGVGSLVSAEHGATPPSQRQYDLIFANILARPLVQLAPRLVKVLGACGVIVLSGLTRDQERWVSAAYRNRGLIFMTRCYRENWATLALRKAVNAKRPAVEGRACSRL